MSCLHRFEALDSLFVDLGTFSSEYKPRFANLGLKFSVNSFFCFSVCGLFLILCLSLSSESKGLKGL